MIEYRLKIFAWTAAAIILLPFGREAFAQTTTANDVVDDEGTARTNSNPFYGKTTLEQLMTRAFNEKVSDGTWHRLFGSLSDIKPQPFCKGETDDWPIPRIAGTGYDLARVVDAGTFKCGYVKNQLGTSADPSNNAVLLRTVETPESVSGLIPDQWTAIVGAASDAIGEPISLEWVLFDTSQAVFDGLRNGDIDAACGALSPDGVYAVTGGDAERHSDVFSEKPAAVARAAVFSAMACPTFLRETYAFAPAAAGGIGTFEDLLAAVKGGAVTDICVGAAPGGGTEATCNHLFDLFAEGGEVTCTGYGRDAFLQLSAGRCQAVWYATPEAGTADDYSSFALPTLVSPVSFFRQTDLPPPEDPAASSKTSLELAVTKSFEALVGDGVWTETFGGLVGIQPTLFCNGDDVNWPADPTPEQGSDLKSVVDRGVFRW